MKFLQLAAVALLLLGSTARAESVRTQVAWMSCGSLNLGLGATTLTFTGNFGPDAYMNIANISPMGIPFTQQARIVNATMVSRNVLRLQLHPMVIGGDLYLDLYGGTTRGFLKSNPRDNVGLELTCSSQINGL